MKAEFVENKAKQSHVGLYKSKTNGDIVFFCNSENPRHGMMIESNNDYNIGHVSDSFIACTDAEIWTRINTDNVTFTW